MKTCKRCGFEKSFSEFRKNERYKDGYTSWCNECHKQRNSELAKENRERLNIKAAEWRNNNPEKIKEILRNSNIKHKEKRASYAASWSSNNLDKRRATAAKRKAVKLNATPAWASFERINEIYSNVPDGYEVDHIVPLTSNLVCGLHCEFNLQYLTPAENQSKKNYWWPEMADEAAYAQGRLFA